MAVGLAVSVFRSGDLTRVERPYRVSRRALGGQRGRISTPLFFKPGVLTRGSVAHRFTTVGLAVIALSVLPWGASLYGQQNFSGLIVNRRIEVDSNALVALLGGKAADPQGVFSLPVERLRRWAEDKREGVQIQETTTRVRNGRARVEVKLSSGNSFVLADGNTSSLYWVHPAHRTVVVWEKPKDTGRRTPTPPPPLLPLGRKESVAGLEAEGYKMARGSETAWVWVARKPESLVDVGRSLFELTRAVKPEAETLDQEAIRRASQLGFPVRVQVLTPAGYVLSEVARWEQREEPEADFEVPRDFQRRTTSELKAGAAGP